MSALAVSRLHFPVSSLGPGQRLGLWVQGCSRGCPGCLAPETWPQSAESIEIEDLLQSLISWLPACQGLTVSGGEPFEQAEGLAEFLAAFRAICDVDILVYTGFEINEIEKPLSLMKNHIDALICGPFEAERPATLALRGSDNQSLHLLTERGRQRFAAYDRPWPEEERRLDLMTDERGGVWLAGIPRPGDLEKIRALASGKRP